MAHNGLKMALFHLILHPKWSTITFGKMQFFTHWSQNGQFPRQFGTFHVPKRVTTGSKRAKNTWLSLPSSPATTLEKILFFALGTLLTHRRPPLCVARVAP